MTALIVRHDDCAIAPIDDLPAPPILTVIIARLPTSAVRLALHSVARSRCNSALCDARRHKGDHCGHGRGRGRRDERHSAPVHNVRARTFRARTRARGKTRSPKLRRRSGSSSSAYLLDEQSGSSCRRNYARPHEVVLNKHNKNSKLHWQTVPRGDGREEVFVEKRQWSGIAKDWRKRARSPK